MIPVDSNVLARLLLRDDESQYRKALKLFGDDREFTAPPTVVLELVWVLGSYGCSRQDTAAALKSLLGLPNFKPADGAAIAMAVAWYEAGMDFGDALHLALSSGEEAFASIDGRLRKQALRFGAVPPVDLL